MVSSEHVYLPSESEQQLAKKALPALLSAIGNAGGEKTEIMIGGIAGSIGLPTSALALLGDMLKIMGEGKAVCVASLPAAVSMEEAARILGCPESTLMKLLDEGEIGFTGEGRLRSISLEDVLVSRDKLKQQQKNDIIDIMGADADLGVYES